MMLQQTLHHPERFWNAIVQEPEADEPRLRYADWLDQRCDPLGEFIRIQCRLARAAVDPEIVWELEEREQELLAEYGAEWSAALREHVDWCTFRRGFVAEVCVDAASFCAQGQQIVSEAPDLTLHLYRAAGACVLLGDCPWLQRIRHLDLSNNFVRDAGVAALVRSPYLRKLVSLNLSSAAIGNAGAMALAGADGFSRLRELYLCDNRLGASGARALAEGSLARQLDVLHVSFNDLSAETAAFVRQRLGNRVKL